MKLFLKDKNLRPVQLLLVVIFFSLEACHSKSGDSQEYYSPDDFSSIKKIDVHAHVMTVNPAMVEQAIKDNFILTSINVEAPDLPRIDSQQYFVLQQRHRFPKGHFPCYDI
jgi:hypothetical protein